jgi:hypothetical protein
MKKTDFAALALVVPSLVGLPMPSAALTAADAVDRTAAADTVHVAPPTGEAETDRASILAALEEAEPGGTVLFGAGTYLVGPVIRIETPRITLLGHPDGSVLRGCDPEDYEASEGEVIASQGRPSRDVRARCGMFELSGGEVTVRGLTFEHSRLGLLLGCCHLEPRFRVTPGGYTIEGNVFRNSLNGVRPWTTETSVIRGNRFVNTFHAISGVGSHLRVLDNDISVPDPSRVPGAGHPSFAIALGPLPGPVANALDLEDNGEGTVIADNRIQGHPDGIFISVSPGTSFRGNEIRANTIEVVRVPIPPDGPRSYIVDVTDERDSTVVGVPMTFYTRAGVGGGGAEELEEGRFEDNLIEGNRLVGAEGVALALQRARRNRILDNVIVGVARREPFPGNTVLSSSELWRDANGSGIWPSPDSDGNEIIGNTFEDVTGAAVFLEGDDNQVELNSQRDEVRDLGTNNHVSVADDGGRS